MPRCGRSLPLLLLLSALTAAAPPSATAPCDSGRSCEGSLQQPHSNTAPLVPLAQEPSTTSSNLHLVAAAEDPGPATGDGRKPIASFTLFTEPDATSSDGECKAVRKLLQEQQATSSELRTGNAELRASIALLQKHLESVKDAMAKNQATLDASLQRHRETVLAALDKKPAVPTASSAAATPPAEALTRDALSKKFLEAAEKDKFDEMERWLVEGADVRFKDEKGNTGLHWAAWNGNVVAVHVLIVGGATVDAANQHDNTPLHWAAWSGRVATLEALATYGADVDARNDDGDTPLIFAAERKGADPEGAVRALLRLGADPKVKGKKGLTARDRASSDEIRALLPV